MSQLKLIALDQQDLEIVSAHVQDAVLKISDISFLAAEKRLVIAINRFVWENKSSFFKKNNERRRSVLHFEGIHSVKSSGIQQSKGDEVLSLLSLRFEPGAELPAGIIELTFSGGAAIRLEADYIEARLADIGGAWEAIARPRH